MKTILTLARSLLRASLFVVATAAASAGCEDAGRSPATADEEDAHPMVGSIAPDFDLPAQSGAGRVSLSALRGKVVVVDFWATWCAPCRLSFPKYQALSERYGDGVVVVGVSEDDEPDGIAVFAEETGATFPLVWDEDKSVAAAYRPSSMPTSYLIDRGGLIRHVHLGFRQGDEERIASRLEELLQ